jgi:methionyl-tRNA formyltransferase
LTQPIGALETAGHLLDSLAEAGADLLLRVVDNLADGTARAQPQAGDVTFAPKLSLDDGRIDWTSTASVAANLVRGVSPEPGAFTTVGGMRLKVLEAAIARDAPRLAPGALALDGRRLLAGTASDPLELLTIQPAGKKPMPAGDWWRGRPSDATRVAE